MSKLFKQILLCATVILLAVVVSSPASAQDTSAPEPKEKPSKPAAKSAAKPVAFSGKVAAMDNVAKTLTLDEKEKRVLQITSETILTKDATPATFADGAVGDAIRGTFKKSDDGKLTALTVNFGAKSAPAKTPAKTPAKPKKDAASATNAPPK